MIRLHELNPNFVRRLPDSSPVVIANQTYSKLAANSASSRMAASGQNRLIAMKLRLS